LLERGKGKTYEQIHGEEKAAELKRKRSESLTKHRKGKTLVEIFGVETADGRLSSERRRAQNGPLSEETKAKIAAARKGKVCAKATCEQCGREIGINNLARHQRTHKTETPAETP
jgi:hypothetical protein